jgi:hypothetical protein
MEKVLRIHLAKAINYPRPHEIKRGVTWTCARESKPGDIAIIYVSAPHESICLVAKIARRMPDSRGNENWARSDKLYPFARLNQIMELKAPLPLEAIRVNFPKWRAWNILRGRTILNIPTAYQEKLIGMLVRGNPPLKAYFGTSGSDSQGASDLHSGPQSFLEGHRKQYIAEVLSRNPQLVEEAKKKRGTTCEVCGFDFGKTYGDLGTGYIEVHHLKPMASPTRTKPRKVGVKDVRVVCSNCHSILHRKKKVTGIREVKKALQQHL